MKNNNLELTVENLKVGGEYKLPVLLDLLSKEYSDNTSGQKRALAYVEQSLKITYLPKKIYRYDGIKEIFEELHDGRGRGAGTAKGKRKDFPNFCIEESQWNDTGVYKITLDKDVYIGSTIGGFRGRFNQHRSKGNNLETKKMLLSGALFEILEVCNGIDEPTIRGMEDSYIEQYKLDTNWNVINQKKAFSFIKDPLQEEKPKILKLKLNKDDFASVSKLLKDNGWEHLLEA